MGLFSQAQVEAINAIAAKSLEEVKPKAQAASPKSINNELNAISERVKEYFKDSPAILITTEEQLAAYIDKCIAFGYAGIDTETTGLDRIHDTIVGASLYVPGMPECYIPMKHLIPIFDQPYKDQLSYEQVGRQLQRLVDAKTKMIFANADFDIAMIYKDLHVDFKDVCYYDVITAWRCLKEDEKDNTLKGLYAKYVMRGKVDPKKFSDFFPVKLFPYCKPEVAKLYAANDAKITYDLFIWQLPYITKSNEKCQKHHLEKIADLIWNIEFPMIKVCAELHRMGVYLEPSIGKQLQERWADKMTQEKAKLAEMVDQLIAEKDTQYNSKRPFATGKDFNPNSSKHVPYLVNTLLGLNLDHANKNTLEEHTNIPVVKEILAIRSLKTIISTFVDKLPAIRAADGRIHATFKALGADTGRLSSSDPNLMNIPSHATDIRHQFRATPQMDEKVEFEDSIKLFRVDKVLVDGEFKYVQDLQVEDAIEGLTIAGLSEMDEYGNITITFSNS